MKDLIRVSIEEVCTMCGKDFETITHFIQEEWIVPADPDQKIFDDEDIHRIRLISDLIDVLGVNEEAVPVILHLIDQIHMLRELRTSTNG